MNIKIKKNLILILKSSILPILLLLLIILLLSGCVHKPNNDKILNQFKVNDDYSVVEVSSDFVSGNKCMWFVSIKIQNKTTGEIINLNDFSYDECEDELYYGWKYSEFKPKLNKKYGEII